MNMNININQPSTLRGIIWLFTGLSALICYFIGKDPVPVIGIGSAVAGGMGIVHDDNSTQVEK